MGDYEVGWFDYLFEVVVWMFEWMLVGLCCVVDVGVGMGKFIWVLVKVFGVEVVVVDFDFEMLVMFCGVVLGVLMFWGLVEWLLLLDVSVDVVVFG